MGARVNQLSTVLVDEQFAAADEQFLESVRAVDAPKYLAALADRWKKDPRPWARRQILQYLALPLDRPGHHPMVKRLFKQAEANRDHELMSAFLVAFDRLVRRRRRMRYRWDPQTRQSAREEELFAPRDQILPLTKSREAVNPRTGQRIVIPPRVPPGGKLFSSKTRGYLRRRAWRYFRRLGFQRPAEYPPAVAAALALYRDDDAASGENILDNWSLTHIAFRRSGVLRFLRTRVELAEGRSLGDLAAAPQFEKLWSKPEAAPVLLKLLTTASSRLVRVWTVQLLKRAHLPALQVIDAEQLLTLLDHADADVQQFGASLLEGLSAADAWPIETWLRLLETRSLTALSTICQAMAQRVRPERLDLAQCMALACKRTTPVARLGLTWLAAKEISAERDRAQLIRMAAAQCVALGAEAARFALSILATRANYQADDVVMFFDSLNPQVRHGAWVWLTPQAAGYDDAALWSRLLESPYDDVRIRLIEELTQRTRRDAVPSALKRQDLTAVWASVLLGVHRGGRAKLLALKQVSRAIANDPDRAEQLMPVLAVAIRSVRPAEARGGLSAILAAVSARPALEATLARFIPELRLLPAGATP